MSSLFNGVTDLTLKLGLGARVITAACGEGYVFAKFELSPLDATEVVVWMLLPFSKREASVGILIETLNRHGATEVERQRRDEILDPDTGPTTAVQAKLPGTTTALGLQEVVEFAAHWFDGFARSLGPMTHEPHRVPSLGCDVRLFLGEAGTPLEDYVDEVIAASQITSPTP